jgi:hypothetical protein
MSKQASLTKTSENKGKNSVAAKPKENTYQTMDSPVQQILNLQQTMGNQAVQRLIKSGRIQAKLTINQPNDKYEQEADRIADQVMRMPEKEGSLVKGHWSLGKKESPLIQRQEELEEEEEQIQAKPLADQITPLAQRQVEPVIEEEEEEETVQPKGTGTQPKTVTPNIESRIQSLKGGGQPLSKSTRDFFESRFGTDFSQVRVHTDSKAGEAAKSINAKAFTAGKDVVFGAGQYSPGNEAGKNLLAHELTHVLQQGDGQYVRRYENESDPSKAIEPEKRNQNTSETAFVDMADLYMMKKHINAIQVYINRYFDWTSVIYFDKKRIAAGIDFIMMEYFTALEVNLTKRGIPPESQLALRAQAALDIKKQIDVDKLSKICSEQNKVTLNTQAHLRIGKFSGILDAGIASGTFTGPPGDQVSEKVFERNLNLMDSVVSNLGHIIDIVDLLPLGEGLSYTCTAAGGILTIIGYPIQILAGLHKIGLANQTDTRLAYARGYSLAMADMHFGRDPSQRALTSVFGTTRTHENNGRNDAIRYIENMKGKTFAKMLLYNRIVYSSGQSMATAIWKSLVFDRWGLNTVSIHVGPKF